MLIINTVLVVALSEKIERLSDSPSNGTMPPSNGDGVKHRHTDLDTKKPKYTKEQVNAVNRYGYIISALKEMNVLLYNVRGYCF